MSNATEAELLLEMVNFLRKEKTLTRIRYAVIAILVLTTIYSFATGGNLLFEGILFISAWLVFYTESRSLSKVCVYMINQYTALEKITDDPASKLKYHRDAGFFLDKLMEIKS